MTSSIFQRPPRKNLATSATYAELPVRTEAEILAAITAIGARGNTGALPAIGGSILITAPLTVSAPIIIPETCPGLTVRAAAKFPVCAKSVVSSLFVVHAEFFTARDLFVYATSTAHFTAFVTAQASSIAGRAPSDMALLDNDVYCDQVYLDSSAGAAARAQIHHNRQVTITGALQSIVVDSARCHIGHNRTGDGNGLVDGVHIGANGGECSIDGNDLRTGKITTIANLGHTAVVGNIKCGTITLGNVSDVQAGNS